MVFFERNAVFECRKCKSTLTEKKNSKRLFECNRSEDESTNCAATGYGANRRASVALVLQCGVTMFARSCVFPERHADFCVRDVTRLQHEKTFVASTSVGVMLQRVMKLTGVKTESHVTVMSPNCYMVVPRNRRFRRAIRSVWDECV
jgi:hypothetical protein